MHSELLAKIRDGNFIEQMLPENLGLLLSGEVPTRALHGMNLRSVTYMTDRQVTPISTGAGHQLALMASGWARKLEEIHPRTRGKSVASLREILDNRLNLRPRQDKPPPIRGPDLRNLEAESWG